MRGNDEPLHPEASDGPVPAAAAMFADRGDRRAVPLAFGGHDPAVGFELVRRLTPIRAATLPLFLEALADQCGDGLLRLKGIVAIAERPDQPAVVHGVQHLFHAPEWLERWPSADRTTRMALIGRRLSGAWAERLLDAIDAEVREIEAKGGGRRPS